MTPWNVAYQAPPSMEFSRQEYWSGFLFPFPGDLLDPGIKLWSPAFQADALTSEPPGSQWCCTGGLSRFPGEESLCQCSGGWGWTSLEYNEVSSNEL